MKVGKVEQLTEKNVLERFNDGLGSAIKDRDRYKLWLKRAIHALHKHDLLYELDKDILDWYEDNPHVGGLSYE